MKQLYLSLLVLAVSLPLFAAKPGAVCNQAPSGVVMVFNPSEAPLFFPAGSASGVDACSDGCSTCGTFSQDHPEANIPARTMWVYWLVPDTCDDITKYAVEVEVHYLGGDCGDPAYSETFKFTAPTNEILVSLGDVNWDDWKDPVAVVKVKALTTSRNNGNQSGGKSKNADQNSPFSVPSSRRYGAVMCDRGLFLDPQGQCVDRCVGMVADLLTRTCVSLASCDNSLHLYYDPQSELTCYNQLKLTSGVPPDCQCPIHLCWETATCCADVRNVCTITSLLIN